MRNLLERYKEETESGITPWESDAYGNDLLTAGVGLYYFEDL
jgi:hypothetical protein